MSSSPATVRPFPQMWMGLFSTGVMLACAGSNAALLRSSAILGSRVPCARESLRESGELALIASTDRGGNG